jgi:hypothetical protein
MDTHALGLAVLAVVLLVAWVRYDWLPMRRAQRDAERRTAERIRARLAPLACDRRLAGVSAAVIAAHRGAKESRLEVGR